MAEGKHVAEEPVEEKVEEPKPRARRKPKAEKEEKPVVTQVGWTVQSGVSFDDAVQHVPNED